MDSMRRIVRALRVSARGVEGEMGISGAQLFVLQQLDRESADSINELAGRTHTHQSSVSVVVTRLVDAGLAVRKPNREDARRTTIELSARGRRLLRKAPVTAQAKLIEGLQRLSNEQVARLAQGLQEWLTESGIIDDGAPLFFEEESGRGEQHG